MNLQKKRLVRTRESEQYALFDLDQSNADFEPASIGKLDLHFTAEGTYGTLLIWREFARTLSDERRELLIDGVVSELAATMGISADYALEVFEPDLAEYELHSNMQDIESDSPTLEVTER